MDPGFRSFKNIKLLAKSKCFFHKHFSQSPVIMFIAFIKFFYNTHFYFEDYSLSYEFFLNVLGDIASFIRTCTGNMCKKNNCSRPVRPTTN